MTFNISEYYPNEVPRPNYKKTDYSLDLELATLTYKNQEQEQNLRTVSNLRSTALNIPMLNLQGRKRLDEYNTQISEQLSGDLGDLTKMENQNKIAGVFQNIATDNELIKTSKLSKQYLDEYQKIQLMKTSGRRDSGYEAINEYVWMNWDGGYNDFVTSDLQKVIDPNFQPTTYTPFKDLKTPLANLAKLLHEDLISREQQTTDEKGNPTGYLTKHTYGGISPERVKALYEEALGADGMAQLEVLSKYNILRSRESGGVEGIYNQYKAFADGELSTQKNSLSETNQRILFIKDKLKTDLSEEEKITLSDELNTHTRNKEILSSNISNLESSLKDKSDFLKMSNNELLPYMYQIHKNEKITNAVNAFSYKKDLQELSPDTTYLAAKKIDAMLAQTRMREDAADNRLRLSYSLKQSVSGKGNQSRDESLWSDGDISKNEQELLSSYDRLNELQNQYAQSTDNILLAPSLDTNSVKAKNWGNFYEKHKGNYYVEMFDVFKNTTDMAYDANGNPNLEAFRLWVEDQEKNPTSLTKTKIDTYRDNQYIHDYLTEELSTINGVLRSSNETAKALLPYARDNNGNPVTEQDFYSGKEVFFWVPTQYKDPNKPYTGGYQKKSLEELMYDVSKSNVVKSTGEYPVFNSVTGQLYQSSMSTYLDNDPGLKQVLVNYSKTKNDPLVMKTMMDKLPQYQQFGYTQTSDPEQIALYQGQISASAKTTNPDKRTLFGVGTIEAISIPKGAGNKGVVKFKTEAAKALEEANIYLPTADGNVSEKVVPGKAYLFETTPIDQRNVMLNMAAQKRPYTGQRKGFTYKVVTLGSGERAVTITKPDGTKIQPTMGGTKDKDIQEILTNINMFIDSVSTQK